MNACRGGYHDKNHSTIPDTGTHQHQNKQCRLLEQSYSRSSRRLLAGCCKTKQCEECGYATDKVFTWTTKVTGVWTHLSLFHSLIASYFTQCSTQYGVREVTNLTCIIPSIPWLHETDLLHKMRTFCTFMVSDHSKSTPRFFLRMRLHALLSTVPSWLPYKF